MALKSALKNLSLPWHTRFAPLPDASRVYFGPYVKNVGGPGLKIRKLKKRFGNSYWNNNAVYVVSGKPIPLPFVQMAKRRGSKVILNQNGVYYPAWYKGEWQRENARLKAYHDLADHVLYQSRFCMETSAKFITPTHLSHEILYNGVDIDAYTPQNPNRGLNPIRLLTATNYAAIHDYALFPLFETLALLRKQGVNATLIIAGHVHMGEAWMRGQAAKYGVAAQVAMPGPFSPEQSPLVFGGADIFIHLKQNDACPSAVIEALAAGLPVVYSVSGGVPELVEKAGEGVFVPESFETAQAPSADKIAAAVVSVLNDYPARALSARRRAEERFSMKTWLDRHAELFETI